MSCRFDVYIYIYIYMASRKRTLMNVFCFFFLFLFLKIQNAYFLQVGYIDKCMSIRRNNYNIRKCKKSNKNSSIREESVNCL